MRTDQRKERMKISGKLIGLRIKWWAMSLLSLCGFGLLLAGAFPLFYPFIAQIVAVPAWVPSSLYLGFGAQSIAYIALGSILVWIST